eukprot:gb/GFBE01046875.1/.p1 GENE.gb/GFBE01046875.1/~~gb/GFBE01046875.1/.p1  ORF type:complete len:807 (+),score=163.64 gb/GFBE01046875.1/:1-2421(+)
MKSRQANACLIRHMLRQLWLVLASAICLGSVEAGTEHFNKDSISAVGDLLDRVLPGSRDHFSLTLTSTCKDAVDAPCYQLSDDGDRVAVAGTSSSELTSALGFYLRSYCNMTIGWPRGGGTNVFIPARWPKIGDVVVRRRSVPWSYMMNVCTHSYSLVWYSWKDWENFIDWMALSGINNVLALTGQEEVQYKVFRSFGLNDTTIRSWFNGPALLTWSRGQNEYGADIAGPLPRSWMREQWQLQQRIVARYRELGIVGQLPGFQGNVPLALKDVWKDANITAAGATGWLDALDPLFGRIADVWMQMMIKDFGTDHWYQLDGYFNGGTAPWLSMEEPSMSGPAVDPAWYARGVAAYESLNRTDPDAIWSFQGFAFEFWKDTPQTASWLRGFVEAVPPGRFNIIDMDYTFGEWQKWNNSAFFGAKFIWTALHNFGANDGLKGNLSRVNEMPFAAQEANTGIWGIGFTPEGIDQNPAYYDFLTEQAWRSERVPDIAKSLIDGAHKRYGLVAEVPEVKAAWQLLTESMYSQDVGVHDQTGVAHLPGTATWDFRGDGHTPGTALCKTFGAWVQLLRVSSMIEHENEPFRYDLINLGRDVLARLSTPLSIDFHAAALPSAGASGAVPSAKEVTRTGDLYLQLLADLDKLVGTDQAFLLGSWLSMARRFGKNSSDCSVVGLPAIASCEDFYEWNARVQITTWNPTMPGDVKIPDGPVDYANKQWSGLISGYYAARAARLQRLALDAAAAGKAVEAAAVDSAFAALAAQWTTAFDVRYPESPEDDARGVSWEMLRKYEPYFKSCGAALPAEQLVI